MKIIITDNNNNQAIFNNIDIKFNKDYGFWFCLNGSYQVNKFFNKFHSQKKFTVMHKTKAKIVDTNIITIDGNYILTDAIRDNTNNNHYAEFSLV